jgi:hypothetical protein
MTRVRSSRGYSHSEIASLSLKLVYAVTRPPIYIKLDACFDRDLASWLTCPGYGLSINAQSHFKTFVFLEECVYPDLVSTNHRAKPKHCSGVCGVKRLLRVIQKQRLVCKLGEYIES